MSKGIRASLLPAVAAALALTAVSATDAEAKLVASKRACPAQKNQKASEPKQERAMRCLIDHARDRAGVRDADSNGKLERAAGRKKGDIVRCGFSHTACGRPSDLWAHKVGYTSGTRSWAFGENLAWGRRDRGSARKVFKAWLASSGHRRTMLHGAFDDMGIGLYRGSFGGGHKTAVWVLQLGCRGC